MKSFILILLVLFLLHSAAAADLEWFGYLESQLTGNDWKDSFLLLQSNKLRLDMKSRVSDAVTVAANVNFITYHGRRNWPVLDFLPAEIAASVPSGMESIYSLSFENRIFLDNAWVKLALKGVDLTVGRQQISLGTGYVWNPVDVFNIKDVLDPTYEQPGHNAIRADLSLGKKYTVSALFAVGESWNTSGRLIRFKGRVGHFDYAFLAVKTDWGFTDFSPAALGDDGFPRTEETRSLVGFSMAGEIMGMGIWGEFAMNWMNQHGDFEEFVLGGDYTFDFSTYLMVEYFHSSLGRRNSREYSLTHWMRLLAQEQKTLARDQFFFMVKHPVTDFIDLAARGIWCLSDGSLALVPTVNWSLSENLELSVFVNLNLGAEGTCYASSSGSGGMVRLRAYF